MTGNSSTWFPPVYAVCSTPSSPRLLSQGARSNYVIEKPRDALKLPCQDRSSIQVLPLMASSGLASFQPRPSAIFQVASCCKGDHLSRPARFLQLSALAGVVEELEKNQQAPVLVGDKQAVRAQKGVILGRDGDSSRPGSLMALFFRRCRAFIDRLPVPPAGAGVYPTNEAEPFYLMLIPLEQTTSV